jgi:molybdate transport system ATP-binding protein
VIEVAIDLRRGDFRLDIAFASEAKVTALVGPSGCGKTTTLSVIAGLVRPQKGRVVLDGTVLLDTEQRIFVPPHRRRVGYVFQDGRLFPHLSVRTNLLFGRWFSRRDGGVDFEEIVELLGIGHLLRRRPAGLSGGEAQRVALGRALLANPRLLLLDEPLASLDEARKDEILPYLERVRDHLAIPMIYVSHSRAEVRRLAEMVIPMGRGAVGDLRSQANF